MLEIIAIIAVVLAIAIAIVLVIAATRPATIRVQRATSIRAPAEKIFPLINDFHQWGTWSPYEYKDPAMKRSYSGPASGKVAVYGWEGNKTVGSGRMEILDAQTPSRVVIKLDFFAPLKATTPPSSQCCRRAMAPMSHQSYLVMHGPSLFIGKIMHVYQHGPYGRQGF